MKRKSCKRQNFSVVDESPESLTALRHAIIVILTEDAEFARLLSACWQAERQSPRITVLSSDLWAAKGHAAYDLVVIGPLEQGKISSVLRSIEPACAVIL